MVDADGLIAASPGIDQRLWPVDVDAPVYIDEGFLSPLECFEFAAEVAAQIEAAKHEPSRVFDSDLRTPTLNDATRTSYNLPPGLPLFQRLYDRMNVAAARGAAMFTGVEHPPEVWGSQLLVYQKSGHFAAHADNTIPSKGKLVTNTPERQFVGLTWLTDWSEHAEENSQFLFGGGQFTFTNIQDKHGSPMVIRPKAGMFVLFPAHYWYRHAVAAVTAGRRISVARWWHVHGF